MYRSSRCEALNNLGNSPSSSSVVVAGSSRSTSFVQSLLSTRPAASGDRNNVSIVASTSVSATDNRANGDASVVHGSMENLYHPVNYRSTSRSRRNRSGRRHRRENEVDRSRFGRYGRRINNTTPTVQQRPTDENRMLYLALDEERKKMLVRRAICSFLYGALRRQSERIAHLEVRVKIKSQEAAARLILHNLLLNSFRNREKEVAVLVRENHEFQKTVENLNLQIRVVRHLQLTEKQKGTEKDHEINALKDKLVQSKSLLDASQAQLTNVEEESRNAHAERQMFEEETCKAREELRTIQEHYEFLTANLELEKKRSAKLAQDSFHQKRKITELRQQVDELTNQSSRWQERARAFESTNRELTLRLENIEKELDKAQTSHKTLNQELFNCKDARNIIKKQNEDLQSKIRTCANESLKLKKTLAVMKAELEEKISQNLELDQVVNNIKEENSLVRNELIQLKLQNLQRRRVWTNLLFAIVSPLETFRCIFLRPSPAILHAQPTSDLGLDPRQF